MGAKSNSRRHKIKSRKGKSYSYGHVLYMKFKFSRQYYILLGPSKYEEFVRVLAYRDKLSYPWGISVNNDYYAVLTTNARRTFIDDLEYAPLQFPWDDGYVDIGQVDTDQCVCLKCQVDLT